jgi:hypothetical protein
VYGLGLRDLSLREQSVVRWDPAHLTHLGFRWQKFLLCP